MIYDFLKFSIPKMRKVFLILLVFIVADNSSGQSLKVFWKIEHPETKTESFLLGVVHISCKGDTIEQRIRENILPYFQQIELLIQEPSKDLSNKEKRELMNIKGGKKLKEIYSEEDYQTIVTFMKQRQISKSKGNDKFLPIWLKSGLMNTYENLSCKEVQTIDEFLEEQAQIFKIQALNIETSEEVLSVVANIPLDIQKELLLEFCRDQSNMVIDSGRFYIDFVYDLEKAYANTFAYFEYLGGRELAEMTLDRSAETMANRLSMILKNKRTFITVGMAFLGSDNGLIRKLENLGFKLTLIEI